MKILHINSYYSTSPLFKQLYDRQIADGQNLDVFVPISFQYPENRIAATGDYTLVSRNHHQYERFLFHLKHYRILKDVQNQYDINQYDLIHAHSLFSNGWVAYQLWKKYQIPYIVAVRSTDCRTFFDKMPWLKTMGLKILKHAAHIVFVSANFYNEAYNKHIPASMHDSLKIKTSIIANGIDTFWLENRFVSKTPTLHKPLRVIAVGKTLGVKRLVPLAQMLQTYSETIQPIELHIVGQDWTKSITEQLKQIPIVQYYGGKSKEELLEIYRQMDLFALLSKKETFGLVYPEAMSQGLPVIYSKNEGFDSFFDNHKIGVSVEKTSESELFTAIDYITTHYQELSKNALESVHQFNWDDIHIAYKNLYQQVLMRG